MYAKIIASTVFGLFLTLPVCAQEQEESKKPSTYKYYSIHEIGDMISSSLLTALFMDARHMYAVNAFKNGAGSIDKVILGASLAGAGYLQYKMPQLIDRYVLKLSRQRTFKQNIITFINRLGFPFPLGVITGEFCAGTDDQCAKDKADDIELWKEIISTCGVWSLYKKISSPLTLLDRRAL